MIRIKKQLTLFFILSFVLSLFVSLALAWDVTPPEENKLDYFPKKIVVYRHAAHASRDCALCHHKPDNADKPMKCSSPDCHDVFDKKDRTTKSFYRIVHGQTKAEPQSCLTCHKAEADKDKDDKELKKALTGCSKSKCHP